MTSQPEVNSSDASPFKQFLNGTIAISPLSIAVLPWGLLAGSYAVDSGLSPFDSQMLSVILYAGAAQLVAIGMLKSGVGLFTMLLTTFLLPLVTSFMAYRCAVKSAHYLNVGAGRWAFAHR